MVKLRNLTVLLVARKLALSPVLVPVKQQLREATLYEQRSKYLVRDNDSKFGTHFKQVAEGAGIKSIENAG